MKKLIYLSALFFVVACAAKKSTPVAPAPPATPPSAASSGFTPALAVTEANFTSSITGFTFAEFQKGKSLYETKCNGCHALIPPSAKPTELWQKMVPVMVGKYNLKNTDYLDETAVNLISGYLVTMTTK